VRGHGGGKSQAECGANLRVLTKICMLVVVRMKVSGYEDGLDEVRSRARRSRVQRNRLVEVVEEEKVGRWKGGLSSRRSEGGCGVIMQFMTPEKLTPK
jgi:hypothetical protein